jgi:hypothetical protein
MTARAETSTFGVTLSCLQGLYFLSTGAWPLVSVESFQWVTGPKSDHLIADPPTEADHWMLNTISALIIAISLVILTAAARRNVTFDICLLGILSAAALTTIDIVYVARGTISPIYLADAAVEVVLILAWTKALLSGAIRDSPLSE